MSRNGSGVYNLPAGNPVVAGTTISTTWANNTLSDIASALTGSVASDGQTPMTGNLNLNNNNINNVASLTAAGTVTALNLTATAATSTVNLSYTGTLTGGTGVINIGSGQIYKDSSGNVGIGTSSPSTYGKLAIEYASAASTITNVLAIRQSAAVDDARARFATYNYNGLATAIDFVQNSSTNFASQMSFSTNGGSGIVERMVINSSGFVGIGTTTPSTKLIVNGASETTGAPTDAGTKESTILAMGGSEGSGSGGVVAFGAFGKTFAAIKGFIADATANSVGDLCFSTRNNVNATALTERMRISSNGGISIGTTASPPSAGILLPINGVINTNGGTLYSYSVRDTTTGAAANTYIDPTDGYFARSTSSIKYKTNVEDIEQPKYKAIYQMRPVWYRSLGERDRKDWSYYGLIAEEVGEIEPRLVHWAKKEDGTLEAEGVMYERLTVLLLAEMKELRAELDATKAKVAALEGAK